jgi:SAM-dependent methyltransferase
MSDPSLCPNCGDGVLEGFFESKGVPVNSCILLASPEEARAYPRGDIRLGFCHHCGFVSNQAYDERLTEYSGRYEETQGFSPTFGAFHERLASRLIERYGLRGKTILEIGCGKGEFLALLCTLGGNRGVGFDPGYVEGRLDSDLAGRITVIRDFYSEKYRDYAGDLVCCKMTLEHIHRSGEFVATVRRAIGDRRDTIVFFQVPEATRILRDCAFEDIYYEHCSYFTPESLERLFRRFGFEVLDVATEYDGQYLTIEARAGDGGAGHPPRHDGLETLRGYMGSFPARCREKLRRWRATLDGLVQNGQRVVLWGSGSKGVSFLTTLGVADEIGFVVDINPFRQGHYMAGTGHAIVGPAFLTEYKPDTVIVMNSVYRDEIVRDLARMGLSPRVVCL